MDVAILGHKSAKGWVPCGKGPKLQTKKKTKLPDIIRWNLIKLVYQKFFKNYPIEVFNRFQCPQNIDSLLFFKLHVYYYTDVRPAVVNEVIKVIVWTLDPLLPILIEK